MVQAGKTASDLEKNCKAFIGPFILLGLLLGAIMANITQFPAIDHHIGGSNNPAIDSYETSNLAFVARRRAGRNPEANFSLYLTLSEVAPDAIIFIPLESSPALAPEMLYGFGRAARVVKLPYNPDTCFADLELDAYVVKQHEPRDLSRGPGPYAFALGGKEPKELVALRRNATWYFTDMRLLSTLLPSDAREVLYR